MYLFFQRIPCLFHKSSALWVLRGPFSYTQLSRPPGSHLYVFTLGLWMAAWLPSSKWPVIISSLKWDPSTHRTRFSAHLNNKYSAVLFHPLFSPPLGEVSTGPYSCFTIWSPREGRWEDFFSPFCREGRCQKKVWKYPIFLIHPSGADKSINLLNWKAIRCPGLCVSSC